MRTERLESRIARVKAPRQEAIASFEENEGGQFGGGGEVRRRRRSTTGEEVQERKLGTGQRERQKGLFYNSGSIEL